MDTPSPLRALIVDDSALNRTTLRRILESSSEIQVVGVAGTGGEALRMIHEREIDVITLDLEMPGMDGFSFLRLLMTTKPTPVIVVSSHTQPENVFRAVELGAFEFVAKPETEAELPLLEESLVKKVLVARNLRRNKLMLRPPPTRVADSETLTQRDADVRRVIAIASSTGGPTAVGEVLSKLPRGLPAAVVIAQHMPEKFTRAFAERLNRYSGLEVSEAVDGDIVRLGCAYVCPGRRSLVVERSAAGTLVLRVVAPGAEDAYVPSADRLFTSVARAVGDQAVGVVLTGMGTDGTLGAAAIARAGGRVIAESEETAVVSGMPSSVVRAGHCHQVLPLPHLGSHLAALVRS